SVSMVHLSPQSDWRRRLDLLSGAVIVLLGIVVAVYAVLGLRQPHGRRASDSVPAARSTATVQAAHPSAGPSSSHPPASATSTPSAAPTATTSAASQDAAATNFRSTPLIVLNDTSETGLAHTAATRFEAGGWTVTSYSNLQNDILSTCAYYDPADSGSKQAAEALQAQFPVIQRVEPKFDGLPVGPVVVVLTGDYS
ncbi:MAG TPA: LytR C-terminal domain-containing protein, partial [Jatrophihabitantaceae bacterium]|nr:LytR C-terminal domain-containing protein [Jatrophihabitantaceae bacterium]